MLKPFDHLIQHDHEELVYRFDRTTGLRALIAVHNTTLGPGLGGTRLWHYDSIEAAVCDVLRLSEGMTYKAAVAGLPLGGGKSVILADGQESDPQIRAERFHVFGKFVEELHGRYIAAEDVGTKVSDMTYIRMSTDHVVGMPADQGGSGDPSPMTAFGVMQGIRALVEDVYDTDDLAGLHVAVQGLGKVGLPLAESLLEAGATVTGTDIDPKALEAGRKLGIKLVEPDAIYDVPCDIFAPCALGAVINDDTIPHLSAKIIAGSANNQLDDPDRHGQMLHDQGIVYAVDYAINAGGLINVSFELTGYDEDRARAKTANIYHTIKRLLKISRREDIPTVKAAHRIAEEALHPVMA